MNNNEFEDAMVKYIAALGEANPNELFEYKMGKRFAKVIHHYYSTTAVFCFVERSTGDVHKSATWHQPQKNGKRGNIYGDNYRPLTLKEMYVKHNLDMQTERDVKKHAPGNCDMDGHVPDGCGFCFRCGVQLGIIEIKVQ